MLASATMDQLHLWLCASVCLCVRTLKEINLSYQYQAWYIYSPSQDLGMHWPWGQKFKVTGLWNVLPAWVCMSLWLLRFLVRRQWPPLQDNLTKLDLLEQEIASGSGNSWAICKSAPWPSHVNTPASHHHPVFYRLDALPLNQHHQSTEGMTDTIYKIWKSKMRMINKSYNRFFY